MNTSQATRGPCFIVETPGQKLSRRAHELQVSRIKSHAARVSWKPHSTKKPSTVSRHSKAPWKGQQDTQGPAKESLSHTDGKDSSNNKIPRSAKSTTRPFHDEADSELRLIENPSFTAWRWSRGSRVDPFGYLPNHLPQSVGNGLDFYLSQWRPSSAPLADTPFGKAPRYDRWLLQNMSLHHDLFYAVVAAWSALLMRLPTAGADRFTLRRNAIEIRGEALSCLRNSISACNQPDDDFFVFTIYLLAYADGVLDDLVAYRLHRQQIDATLRNRGGIQNLRVGDDVKAQIWRLQTWQLPEDTTELAQKQDDPLKGACPPLFYKGISVLPEGFQRLIRHDCLSGSSIQVISSIQRIQTDPSPSFLQGLFDACPAMGLSTFSLKPNADASDDSTQLLGFEHILRLALIWFHAAFTPYGSARSKNYRTLAMQMRNSLPLIAPAPATAQGAQHAKQDCLLWMWLIAAIAWQDRNPFTARWLLKRSQQPDRFPQSQTWSIDDFERFGTQFFWNHDCSQRLRTLI